MSAEKVYTLRNEGHGLACAEDVLGTFYTICLYAIYKYLENGQHIYEMCINNNNRK